MTEYKQKCQGAGSSKFNEPFLNRYRKFLNRNQKKVNIKEIFANWIKFNGLKLEQKEKVSIQWTKKENKKHWLSHWI